MGEWLGMEWHVYVLLCSNNNFYTGTTNNLEKRYEKHKAGKGAKYTRAFKPIRIIYSEKLDGKILALAREREIKSWTRDQKIVKLGLSTDI